MKQLISAAKLSLPDLGAVRGDTRVGKESGGGSGGLPWVTSNRSPTSPSSDSFPHPSFRLSPLSFSPLRFHPTPSTPTPQSPHPLPPGLSVFSPSLYTSSTSPLLAPDQLASDPVRLTTAKIRTKAINPKHKSIATILGPSFREETRTLGGCCQENLSWWFKRHV